MIARVIHQDRHGPLFRDDLIHQLLCLIRIRHIELIKYRVTLKLFQNLRCLFGLFPAQYHSLGARSYHAAGDG